jgi:hypothetical protein
MRIVRFGHGDARVSEDLGQLVDVAAGFQRGSRVGLHGHVALLPKLADDVHCPAHPVDVALRNDAADLVRRQPVPSANRSCWKRCTRASSASSVIAADGRVADLGSFRGAGVFLDEHLTRDQEGWREGAVLHGNDLDSHRADLTPVYAMIFRRLQAVGADWGFRGTKVARTLEFLHARDFRRN